MARAVRSGIAPILALAVASWTAGDAHATTGTAFGETSRVAALARAVSARPGDAGSMLENPAGLADVDEPVVLLHGHVERLSQWFARTGEPPQDGSRWLGGFGLAAATPLPGPWWLRRVRVGLALDLPAAHVLRVSVPERLDQPTSPIYDGRPDRMGALGALAVKMLDRLELGAGLSMTPSLATPTAVTFVAGRDPSLSRDVVVRLDRDLDLDVTPFLGLRAEPLDSLGLAVVYRAAAVSHASGSQRTVAGGVLANDPIDYAEFWDPAELVLGAAVAPFARWSISADVTFHHWSQFKNGFDRDPQPAFKDTTSVRAGVEWQPRPWLSLRGGGAFEPTPIPDQIAQSNYMGADTFVLAVGGGVDLRKLLHAPLKLDAHLQTRLGATQSATKQTTALPDADPNLPGKQIDNLGYPGFQSSAQLYQVGLTVTLFVGKEKP